MIDTFESSFAGGACNDAVRAHDFTAKPAFSMLSTISRTCLTSNWLHGFVLDSQTVLPAALSCVVASTAIVAFIVFSSQWSEFCFAGNAERCIKSKCPSGRGNATVRPRRQGRVRGVYRSEAESLDGRSGRIRQDLARKDQRINFLTRSRSVTR
jgi:hypothetical protein